jgi:hypothetical protein
MWFLGPIGGFLLWLVAEKVLPSKDGVLATAVFSLCMMAGIAVVAWADGQTLSLILVKLEFSGPASLR